MKGLIHITTGYVGMIHGNTYLLYILFYIIRLEECVLTFAFVVLIGTSFINKLIIIIRESITQGESMSRMMFCCSSRFIVFLTQHVVSYDDHSIKITMSRLLSTATKALFVHFILRHLLDCVIIVHSKRWVI